MRHLSFCAVLLITATFLTNCNRKPPENVAAMVNDRAITTEELDRQFGQLYPDASTFSEDQVLVNKLEVLRSLIDGEIMMQRAEKLSLTATDADVDAKVTEMKSPMTQEEFQRWLDQRKLTLAEFRRQIRRNLSIDKLLNKEILSQLQPEEAEIRSYYEKNQATFTFQEPQIHLAQILVTPRPDSEVKNRKNDDAQSEPEAQRKIQMLESRLKSGEDFGQLAASYSEDAPSAMNGGDLGYIGESAMERVSPELRKLLMSLPVGVPSPIIATPEGFRVFKVFSREAAGQRDLSDPRVQQAIRQSLLENKQQLLKSVYYETARNDSTVKNFFAEKIVSQRRKP